jgi:hypothetical protein
VQPAPRTRQYPTTGKTFFLRRGGVIVSEALPKDCHNFSYIKLVAAELDAARNKLLHQRRGIPEVDVPGAISGRRRGTPTAS